jgi:hypothetical protein
MTEVFGRSFYEWWGGLSRGARIGVALFILGCSGVAAIFFPDAWGGWGPTTVAGAVLLLMA